MTEPIVTPCHGAPLMILTQPEGRAYMQSDVPSEILCTADGCFNSWSAKGEPESFNKPNAQPSDPSFCPPLTPGEDDTCTHRPACPTDPQETSAT